MTQITAIVSGFQPSAPNEEVMMRVWLVAGSCITALIGSSLIAEGNPRAIYGILREGRISICGADIPTADSNAAAQKIRSACEKNGVQSQRPSAPRGEAVVRFDPKAMALVGVGPPRPVPRFDPRLDTERLKSALADAPKFQPAMPRQ